MLEWLAVSTGVELGKLVLEQVLNLSKPVLEGYVQDFFGDCLDSGVTRLKFGTLKEPMAEAIGCFIKRFIEELQLNFVPETSIEHHYRGAIKRFVRDKAVGQILGKAFETDCKQIDYAELERLWAEKYQDAAWQFPENDFDWRGIAKKYVFEVKGIVRANPELRALLETDLLETIAQNTAQVSPGFDIKTYRESLQCSYGYLKLYTLDSTDRVDAIKLWNIFVEQTVREALPPTRYELPLDLKRKLQEEGQLEGDLSPESLEHYRREYFEQPARKVLEAVEESQRAVILGDPGSGKSSLLQYLALEWVEGKTETLPLLIELREFVVSQCSNFLEFLHRGRGADWQFDQQQLHQHLLAHPTLVMFDGLDEIFDRSTQAAVTDDIVRFAQQYPQAQVLVTSRIIGYNPDRLRHSKFRHFTIQSLDTDEINEFIDRWYDLSMGGDLDKERLKQRLKDAIENSKAIQNLADNLLLLTMMAILNRRQELPRDRADLYDQASRVLLYHWDVDHKRLQLPLDAIGRREKQEMLRLIAYGMQSGAGGLKGNMISAEILTRILTAYLQDQGFSEPRVRANLLIQQLRERNHILCYRGAETYSFVHRTFLEYFCALEIVHQFEKQHKFSFEQFKNNIFEANWQDKSWHEVLRLICNMIDPHFACGVIDFLMNEVEFDKEPFIRFHNPSGEMQIRKEGIANLLFAADCFSELKKISVVNETRSSLYERLLTELDSPEIPLHWGATREVMKRLIENFSLGFERLIEKFSDHPLENVREALVYAVPIYCRNYLMTFSWLKSCLLNQDWRIRMSAAVRISDYYSTNQETWPILLDLLQKDTHSEVRWAAIWSIGNNFVEHPETYELVRRIAVDDPFVREVAWDRNPRQEALEVLVNFDGDNPDTIKLLKERTEIDSDPQLREWAQQQLEVWEQ